MMRCENHTLNPWAYFGAGERRLQRCDSEATTRIQINPPKPDNDGAKRVCDDCAKWDFLGFNIREALPKFDGPTGAPSDTSPKASAISELEPDGYEAERTRRDADQAGGGSEGIARRSPFLAGGLQRGECFAAVGGSEPHDLTENADTCATCNGIGVVGYAPDDYWNCPDCSSLKAALASVAKEPS